MRIASALLAGLVLALLMLTPSAAAAQPSETAVKAEFLPRFARYVTWPADSRRNSGGNIILCVIGQDPFGSALDRAARSQSVDGNRIIVRRLSSAEAAGGCHIAYVKGSRTQPAGQMIAALGRRPILIVTDAGNDGPRGIIHFSVVSGRVRFFIDEAGAAQRGLSISSRLLALAVGVRQR